MASDHAGHAHAVLDEQGDAVDGKGGDEVQAGHREVHLDAARGFFLRLHGEHGEFGDGHRKRHRRVLDDVHALAGQRRHDDAKRHWQQHIAVGLRQRQPHGQARVALPLGQALDARAHLLGDARAGEEAQRQHHEDEARKRLQRLEDRRQHVVPQEDLYQQRNIAKQLDPGVAQANNHRPVLQGAQRANERTYN